MINKNVKSLFFYRSWIAISGAVTVFIVPQSLTFTEQGLFFTFLSIVAIQSVFEAGITTVFFNFVASENGKIAADSQFSNKERQSSIKRLKSLVKIAERWFLILAALFMLIVGTFGYMFFYNISIRESLSLQWQLPFFILVFAISLSLFNLSRIPILEGCGFIADVAKFRFRASALSMTILWVGIFFGYGLWALGFSYMAQSSMMILQTSLAFKLLPLENDSENVSSKIDEIEWKSDILPMQMRLAVSFFCGYCITQAVVPYTLEVHGSETAGRLGLILSIFNALGSILASFVYATGPKYATLIVRRETKKLADTFTKVTAMTLGASTLVFSAISLLIYIVHQYNFSFSQRVVGFQIVISLSIIGLTNAYVGSVATLLRAQKKEPMLPVSILVAFFYMITMIYYKNGKIEELFTMFSIIQVGLALPITVFILRRSKLLRAY